MTTEKQYLECGCCGNLYRSDGSEEALFQEDHSGTASATTESHKPCYTEISKANQPHKENPMPVTEYVPCQPNNLEGADDTHKYSTAAIQIGSIVIGANDDGELVVHQIGEPVDCVNFGWYAIEFLMRNLPFATQPVEFDPETGTYQPVERDLQDGESHP